MRLLGETMRLHIEAGQILPLQGSGISIVRGFLVNSGEIDDNPDKEPAVLKIIDSDQGDLTPVDGFVCGYGSYTSGCMDFNEEVIGSVQVELQGAGSKATVYYNTATIQES